jgi:uncharacterized membrane protein HdeD (DUF308 family)
MSEHQTPQYSMPRSKPGMLQAIAILCLVDGILNIILGLILVVSLLATIVCWPIGAYPIAVGVLEIIYAAQLLPEPANVRKPAQYLAIMQIVNILCGSVVSLVTGILSLVFYNDPQVRAYFARIASQEINT